MSVKDDVLYAVMNGKDSNFGISVYTQRPEPTVRRATKELVREGKLEASPHPYGQGFTYRLKESV